jgi:site-specific recombinase XerD
VSVCAVPVTDLGAMMRRLEVALRDREWEKCPVGAEVSRFMRAFRWTSESEHSHRAYESVLALLALRHSDWKALEDFCSPMGTEYLREFLDAEWGACAPATKARQVGIIHSFFGWAAREGRISYDPSVSIRAPKMRRRAVRQAYDLTVLHRLVSSQASSRDQVALELLCRLGLRRAELREVRIEDIDLVRGYIFVHGKGRKDELLPLPRGMQDSLYLHIQGDERRPKEYLLYARDRRFQPMSLAGVHNWFKRCVKAAGLPETMTMHEMRHSAAEALRRERGDVALAQQLLRHSSLATTEAYLHPTKRDLADALEAMDEVWGRAGV